MVSRRSVLGIALLLGFVLSACQPISRPSNGGSDNTTAVSEPCKPTPFYNSISPPAEYPDLPAKLTLPKPEEPGEQLIVTGVVYAEDCVTPLAGTLLEVWQANTAGEYTYLEGKLRTDAEGRYEISTIKPGMYGAPAHIHFRIFHPTTQSIETELLFAGEPNVDPNMSEVAITELSQETTAEGNLLRANFNIVLRSLTP